VVNILFSLSKILTEVYQFSFPQTNILSQGDQKLSFPQTKILTQGDQRFLSLGLWVQGPRKLI
jgi:hypothetical protein